MLAMAPKRKTPVSRDSLLAALADIKNGMSYREASKKYDIPKSTLNDKINDRVPLVVDRPGPGTYLTADQENRLVNWLITMAKIGYGVPRKDIPNIVKNILDEAEKKGYIIPETRKFPDNKPSVTWIYAFLERHPEVSARMPENLGFQRASINEADLRLWYNKLEIFLKDEHNLDIKEFLSLENADRIFNLDESGFPLQGTNGKLKVVTAKGTKTVYKIKPETKEQITVLACVSASGYYSNPFVLFPGLRLPKFNFSGVNENEYDVGHTPNG